MNTIIAHLIYRYNINDCLIDELFFSRLNKLMFLTFKLKDYYKLVVSSEFNDLIKIDEENVEIIVNLDKIINMAERKVAAFKNMDLDSSYIEAINFEMLAIFLNELDKKIPVLYKIKKDKKEESISILNKEADELDDNLIKVDFLSGKKKEKTSLKERLTLIKAYTFARKITKPSIYANRLADYANLQCEIACFNGYDINGGDIICPLEYFFKDHELSSLKSRSLKKRMYYGLPITKEEFYKEKDKIYQFFNKLR